LTLSLESLGRCLQGIVPSVIATCARDGTPNVTLLSQVYRVDDRHVALSCQFFNKTRRNVEANPHACVYVNDPLTVEAYRLEVRYVRSETVGPLYEMMALRIEAIASHTGMAGIFRLLSADVYEVLAIERIEGAIVAAETEGRDLDAEGPTVGGPMTELRGLQVISDRVNRARDLDTLLGGVLGALDDLFGFGHSMVLVPDETGARLVAVASRGYGDQGIGAEVPLGAGLIGSVAEQRRILRFGGIAGELRYGRAIRDRVEEVSGRGALGPEIPLPGLADAQSHLALPLVVHDRLVGVLALESRDPLAFDEWDEAYLHILSNQIAIGIATMLERDDGDDDLHPQVPARVATRRSATVRRGFCFYRNDDCVFVDGEYLIRNIPGKILWKLLTLHQREGRTEFTNRELRLDPGLGLPAYKDNLESRLLLLRRRLEQKCPDVRIVPVRRGRFALEVGCALDLVERDSA
jgi:adenylate cyclase